MKKVLFVCTHNSARSQMAEGLLRAFYGDKFEAYSAGTNPAGVNPYAIKVMKEIGVDISKHRAKSLDEFKGIKFDYVVTLCNGAKESCPFYPNATHQVHKEFKDPSEVIGSREDILSAFREVRNEIKKWIDETFGTDYKEESPVFLSV